VRQYLWLFEEAQVLEYVILAGDHLYRMDYQHFIQVHRETNADITVAALPMDEARATAFGLMKINDQGRIIEFAEKPSGDELRAMQVLVIPESSSQYLILAVTNDGRVLFTILNFSSNK